jgi:hypothetical protein
MSTPADLDGSGICQNCFSKDYALAQACDQAAAAAELSKNPKTADLGVTSAFRGYYCPNPPVDGSPYPKPCPAGQYCPGYSGSGSSAVVDPSVVLTCPAGKTCIEGVQTPSECPLLSSCPRGTGWATDYSAVIIVVVTYLVFYIGWRIYR